MRLRSLLVAAALATATLAAHADTVTLYNVDVTLANGGTVTGTVDLDEGVLDSAVRFSIADLVYTLNGVSLDFNGRVDGGAASLIIAPDGEYTTGIDFQNGAYGFQLALPTTTAESFAGYTGGSVCTTTSGCSFVTDIAIVGGTGTFIDATSGSLTPAVTPEPSSFALLGTGLLGLAGLAHKRFV